MSLEIWDGDKMNILFLGIIYNKEKENEILRNSKIGLQGASNLFQYNIIEGLAENLSEKEITVLSVLPVGTFPFHFRKLFLNPHSWSHEGINFQSLGSLNLHFIKQIHRYIQINKTIENWILKSEENKQIVVYSLYPIFILSLKKLKKKYPDIKITTIVPDLPSTFGILSKNPIKAQIEKKIGTQVIKNLRISDYFVLLTEKMKVPLEIEEKPFVVIEGVVTEHMPLKSDIAIKQTAARAILYTGSLNSEFGIVSLIEAFHDIEDNSVELWICGSGECEQIVKEFARRDKRINFFGYLPQKKIKELQSLATLLVNPRKNEGIFTKYSFPSKTMEYLASGKPVLMYKLDGVPDEYDQYLYYVRGNSKEELKSTIIKVLNESSEVLEEKGKIAKQWVIRNKNSKNQAAKIINMIKQ